MNAGVNIRLTTQDAVSPQKKTSLHSSSPYYSRIIMPTLIAQDLAIMTSLFTLDPASEEALLRDLVQITIDDPTFHNEIGVSLSRDDILTVTGVVHQFLHGTFANFFNTAGPDEAVQAYSTSEDVRISIIQCLKPVLRPPSDPSKPRAPGGALTLADRARLNSAAMKRSFDMFNRQRVAEAAANVHQQSLTGFKNEPYKSKVDLWRNCAHRNHLRNYKAAALATQTLISARQVRVTKQ